MKAKITTETGYRCAPNGHTEEFFAFGEVVQGQVAEWALKDHSARRIMAKTEPLENKANKPRENKRGRK